MFANTSNRRASNRASPAPRGLSKSPGKTTRNTANLSSDAINAAYRRGLSAQSYDKSYAYGASHNGNETVTRRRSGISPAEESEESEKGSPAPVNAAPDPAARYAKYKQPEQPVAGPSQPRPLAASYRPHEGGVQTTSVNIATVMRNHPLSRVELEEEEIEADPDISHDTVPEGDGMHIEEEDEEEDPAQGVTFDQGEEDEEMAVEDEEQEEAPPAPRGKKRKSSRGRAEDSPEEPEGAPSKKKRGKQPARHAEEEGRGDGAPPSESGRPNGRTLGRDRTWAPEDLHNAGHDDEEDSDRGEGIAPTKARRSLDPHNYDETSSPEVNGDIDPNGTSYRLREPTDSTSFSQEEEIVDHELAQRQQQAAEAAAQQRMHEERMRISRLQREERERKQMPPPVTPHPPGRYMQTPAQQRSRLHQEHDGLSDEDHTPPPAVAASAAARKAFERVLGLLRSGLGRVADVVRRANWSWLRWALLGLLMAGLFGAYGKQKPESAKNRSRTGALTDSRAAQGLWRFPSLRNGSFSAPEAPPESLNAVIHRLTKLEQSQSSLTSQQSTLSGQRFNDKQELDKRLERLEEPGRKVDVAKLEKAVAAIQSGIKELQSDVEIDRNNARSLDERLKASQNEVKTLKERVGKVFDATRADRIAIQINEAVDSILPQRLAVSVNGKTGKLEISPEFWSALRSEFVEASEVQDKVRVELGKLPAGKSSASSWSDFVRTNEADIQRLLEQTIDGKVNSGAILSRAAFKDQLERDVRSVIRRQFDAGMNDRINDNVAEIGREMSAAYDRKQIALMSRVEALEKSGAGKTVLRTSKGDDVQSIVEEIVNAALIRHTKDVIARADYALFSGGARIVPELTSPTFEARPAHWWQRALASPFGAGVIRGRPPVVALHPDTNVGSCWAFSGHTAQLGVRLSRSIILDAIVLEHAPAELVLDRRSAPADFEVWGEVTEPNAVARLRRAHSSGALAKDDEAAGVISSSIAPSSTHVRLVAGRYDATSSASTHIQIFDSLPVARSLDLPVSVLVLRILGLHGESEFGCLYRFRALGIPTDTL